MDVQKKLSEAEAEVMEAVWDFGRPVLVAELLRRFAPEKGWKTSTLSTLLARLMDKGFVTKSLAGKANYYTPLLTREEYKRSATRTFLETVHGGSLASFVASLSGGAQLSEEELAELRAWALRAGGER